MFCKKNKKYYFAKKWECHGTPGTPGVDGPDSTDAEIVDKYLTNNSNSKKINLAYYIDQKASLKKKLKGCNGEIEQIEVKPKNKLVIQLNTAAFQLIVQKCCLFLFKKNN